MTTNDIANAIETRKARSAWSKGVNRYAFDLLEDLDEDIKYGYFDETDLESPNLLRKQLLNGASNWSQYSWGGCSLIYNDNIARRLCTPSELRKTRNGERKPNAKEEWLDTQARALAQACTLIINTACELTAK